MWPSPETAEIFSCGAYRWCMFYLCISYECLPVGVWNMLAFIVWDLCEQTYKQQCTLFNLTKKKEFMSEVKTLYSSIGDRHGGVKKKKWKNLPTRFVILFGEVSHYFRYITFIRHICTRRISYTRPRLTLTLIYAVGERNGERIGCDEKG